MEVLEGHFSGHREGGARRSHFSKFHDEGVKGETSSSVLPTWTPAGSDESSHAERRKIARDNLQADFCVALTRLGTWSGLQSIRVLHKLDSCSRVQRYDYHNYENAELPKLEEDCFHTGRKLCVKCLDERA